MTTLLNHSTQRFLTQSLRIWEPLEVSADVLIDAMRYAVNNGGKRLRPGLAWGFCEALGGSFENADRPALAVELIHTYSLIHDDLPCMDDDDLRRGQPACHIKFGEGQAVLAGDALQSLAFQLLTDTRFELAPLANPAACVAELARAAGPEGMVDGQAMDMLAEASGLPEHMLEQVHSKKTGALIAASCVLGAFAAGANQAQLETARNFGQTLGLAFQVQDDCLDITSSSEQLGKPSGSDLKADKLTFVKLLGLAGAQDFSQDLFSRAQNQLKSLDQPGLLSQLTDKIAQRSA